MKKTVVFLLAFAIKGRISIRLQQKKEETQDYIPRLVINAKVTNCDGIVF